MPSITSQKLWSRVCVCLGQRQSRGANSITASLSQQIICVSLHISHNQSGAISSYRPARSSIQCKDTFSKQTKQGSKFLLRVSGSTAKLCEEALPHLANAWRASQSLQKARLIKNSWRSSILGTRAHTEKNKNTCVSICAVYFKMLACARQTILS
jgi:hypothetical protein